MTTTVLAFVAALVLGSLVLCALLGRRNRAPQDEAEWHRLLASDARRLLGALELQVTSDKAMARDAMRRAKRARDSRAYREALRLVDLAADLMLEAVEDRTTRLRAMGIWLRMAGAVAPLPPLLPGGVKLGRTRALFAAGAIVHHVLVSASERLGVRILLLRFAYGITAKAFLRGHLQVTSSPEDLRAWAACEGPVDDLTGVLDPAHVLAFQALLASVERPA